jgi:hypothetical protein
MVSRPSSIGLRVYCSDVLERKPRREVGVRRQRRRFGLCRNEQHKRPNCEDGERRRERAINEEPV